MPRSEKVDDLDRQILELLHEDPRIPSTQVARLVGVTDRTVRNHIDKMIEMGLLRIGLLIDQQTAGYPVVALVFFEVQPGRANEIANIIAANNYVSFVATSTGDADIVAQVYVQTNKELHELVQNIFGRIDGVRRTRTNILPSIFKRPASWFPDDLRISNHDRNASAIGGS
jgi:Lrp/AsnC family transcriptional regulator, regulator for asnA, asnC and gidA